MAIICFTTIPIRGTASDVVGIDSATKFKNTVNDSRIVTPVKFVSPRGYRVIAFGFLGGQTIFHFIFAIAINIM